MIYPSKRVAAIAVAEVERKAAFHANDPVAFAAAVAKIQEHEASEDEYTCARCSKDFPATDAHVEILAAAVLVFPGGDGNIERYDYGINDVTRGEVPGRRFKFCGGCIKSSGWKIHPRDYVEMR
jgi:hypothetical protein